MFNMWLSGAMTALGFCSIAREEYKIAIFNLFLPH